MNLLDYDLGDAIATKKLSLQGEKKYLKYIGFQSNILYIIRRMEELQLMFLNI